MSNYPLLDRDLSWLSYNYRVLLEARDRSVPTLERLRFIAIYSHNLDEFFRVRVADIRSLSLIKKQKIHEKAGFNPTRKLNAIFSEIDQQQEEFDKTLREVLKALELKNISFVTDTESLEKEHLEKLNEYFTTKVMGLLQPYIYGINRRKPALRNQQSYLALRLGKEDEVFYAYVNIPTDQLGRFYRIVDGKKYKFVFIDDIIRHNLNLIFRGYEVLECKAIKFNKDEQLHIDEEFSGALLEKINKQIDKNRIEAPSRFLYDKYMSDELLDFFKQQFSLTSEDLFKGRAHHQLSDFLQIDFIDMPGLAHPPLIPVSHAGIDDFSRVMDAVNEADQLLHFPFQSYDYVLKYFNEAVVDQDIYELYTTFYRLSKDKIIADALISAAQAGKKVFIFMDKSARLDKENNAYWAKKLKAAGVKIIYNRADKKMYANAALFKKRIDKKNVIRYGFFCTANLNENSAKTYVDYGFMTVDEEMLVELERLFKYVIKGKELKQSFEQLAVSQFNAVDLFKEYVDKEVEFARQGIEAKIIVKVNNLEDTEMIEKLYEAAAEGVKVVIITRSICSLVPDLNNIEVYRLVDRFIEHTRVFYFFHEGSEYVLIGSSDWMTRNLRSRIEVSVPIYDQQIKRQIVANLNRQLSDNIKLVRLDKDLNNQRIEPEEPFVNSQSMTYQELFKANS